MLPGVAVFVMRSLTLVFSETSRLHGNVSWSSTRRFHKLSCLVILPYPTGLQSRFYSYVRLGFQMGLLASSASNLMSHQSRSPIQRPCPSRPRFMNSDDLEV